MQFPLLVIHKAWYIDRENKWGALIWVDDPRYVNDFTPIPLLIST
jgi:hypothetical protein